MVSCVSSHGAGAGALCTTDMIRGDSAPTNPVPYRALQLLQHQPRRLYRVRDRFRQLRRWPDRLTPEPVGGVDASCRVSSLAALRVSDVDFHS